MSTTRNYYWAIPFVFFCLIACQQSHKKDRQNLSLAGCWNFKLDSLNQGETEQWYKQSFSETIQLPGTTDTNQKGYINNDHNETTHLARPFFYQGKAWYQKEVYIPDEWKGKEIILTLERTKPTLLWVDTTYAGCSDDISTPQQYNLSSLLFPGNHRITILVDNGPSVPPQLLENSHAYTESTQTNWNGIIGELSLEARPLFHIQQIEVYPHAASRTADVRIQVNNPEAVLQKIRLDLQLQAYNSERKHQLHLQKDTTIGQTLSFTIEMGDEALEWSEYAPALYQLTVCIQGENLSDSQSVSFGLRDFKTHGSQFTINGLTTFLRGKHDACVFPQTGHVPMDTVRWRHYFRTAKAYGINHCRFHSWCPPKACFEAADLEGFYLQPELPFWGRIEQTDSTLVRFLTKEGQHILQAYGNHASFVMMAIGNELSGDAETMSRMIDQFRQTDGRRLYAAGSNNNLGYSGPFRGDDYFTTCRVPGENITKNHTRGSFSFADAEEGGYINHTYPNSEMNFRSAVEQCPLPIIGHETGQFQCYPNYKELTKYTGVLKPWNLECFRDRLKQAGMLSEADSFFIASGKWMVQLYRAEMEMAIRTQGMAGFQLLDLQDYPGQGTALVGVLDAFMDSKGLTTPEEWRESCNDIVLLALLPRFCYVGGEELSGTLKVANYSSKKLTRQPLRWELINSQGTTIAQSQLLLEAEQGTLTEVGTFAFKLPDIVQADRYTFHLYLEGSPYHNHYYLWIYPKENLVKIPSGIKIVKALDKQTEQWLDEGGNILYFPQVQELDGVTVGGLFQTDYWNYRMFKSICEWVKKPISPGTLGLLMNPAHHALAAFPTKCHTDWQWYTMVKQSHPLILDRLPQDYRPIVQVIDNVERNHKLGLIFELAVGKGKLLVCMTDLDAQQHYPEARQLYYSLLCYMESVDFVPTQSLSFSELKELFTKPIRTSNIKQLGNISYD